MMYLTGASNDSTRAAAYDINLGIILNPESHYDTHVVDYPAFAIDNGCFSQGARFSLPRYMRWLKRLQVHQQKCLFAVAPDVFHPSGWAIPPDLSDPGSAGVTIAEATWERSKDVLPLIRSMGYKAALVAQNGLEIMAIDWDAFDVLFIGGTTEWKVSIIAAWMVRQAKANGKWVHMGRVNSETRLRIARDMGCDSADGTYIKYGPDINLQRLSGWLDRIA